MGKEESKVGWRERKNKKHVCKEKIKRKEEYVRAREGDALNTYQEQFQLERCIFQAPHNTKCKSIRMYQN